MRYQRPYKRDQLLVVEENLHPEILQGSLVRVTGMGHSRLFVRLVCQDAHFVGKFDFIAEMVERSYKYSYPEVMVDTHKLQYLTPLFLEQDVL